jgi:hypothetical protein
VMNMRSVHDPSSTPMGCDSGTVFHCATMAACGGWVRKGIGRGEDVPPDGCGPGRSEEAGGSGGCRVCRRGCVRLAWGRPGGVAWCGCGCTSGPRPLVWCGPEVEWVSGGVLLSHTVPRAVPSAL